MKAVKILALRAAFLALFLAVWLALPQAALAAGGAPKGLNDEFVFGDNYTLEDGETLEESLWVFGGNATLEEGSTVEGSVMVFGGNLVADGLIEGDVNVTGGSVLLGSTAQVNGDVNMTGGSMNRESGAQVDGEINENFRGPFNFDMPEVRIPGVRMPWVEFHNPFWSVLNYFFRAFLVSALAVLVAMFLPRQMERTSNAAVAQPLVSGGMGLLTGIVAPLILVGIAITIILIPVTILGFILLAILVVFGWIALGLEVGQRMARMLFKTEWTLPVAAGLGTLVLTLVVDGIGQIACVGWLAPVLVGAIGLGAVLLTRFGTQPYTGMPAGTAVPPPSSAPSARVVEPPETMDEPPTVLRSGAAVYPAESEPPFTTPELPPDEES